MDIKNIMRLIPMAQSASLANENLKILDKKTKSKDLVKLGVKNIVGINLIKIESDVIEGI